MTNTNPHPISERAREAIVSGIRNQAREDETYGPSLDVTKADAILSALDAAGLVIRERGEVCLDPKTTCPPIPFLERQGVHEWTFNGSDYSYCKRCGLVDNDWLDVYDDEVAASSYRARIAATPEGEGETT